MSLNDHKTKITGLFIAIVSALQANSDTIQSVLPPKYFAYFTAIMGTVVTALGFSNSSKNNSDQANTGAQK